MAALSKSTIVTRVKLYKSVEYLYTPAVSCPKFTILRIYMRIFTAHDRRSRYITYITGAVIVLYPCYGIIISSVSCRPFTYNWDKEIPGGTCIDVMANYRWVSLPNIITDLVLISLSMPAIWKLQVPLITKISLIFTFLLGSL